MLNSTTTSDNLLADHERMVATLTLAFSADPVFRWMYPEAMDYLAYFPELVRQVGRNAFSRDCADGTLTPVGFAGVALWVPPDSPREGESTVELLLDSIDAARHSHVFAFLGQLRGHHPASLHWYLPLIGVDPGCQGQGYGAMLLERGLARCDDDRLPAYLEATTPRNRVLYERHGFEVTGEIQAGDSPPLWPMLRTAR